MAQDQHSCASKHIRSNAPESQPAAPTLFKVKKPGVSRVRLSAPPTAPQLQPVTSLIWTPNSKRLWKKYSMQSLGLLLCTVTTSDASTLCRWRLESKMKVQSKSALHQSPNYFTLKGKGIHLWLVKGWIVKSNSSCANMALCICILTAGSSITGPHDSLRGYSWLLLLDQGKVYH